MSAIDDRLSPPDIYFTPGYGAAAASVETARWMQVELERSAWLMPLLVRPTPYGMSDAISPYGYSGVYFDAQHSTRSADELWELTRDELRSFGLIAVFVRSSPLVPQAPPPRDAVPITRDHPIYVVDIDETVRMLGRMPHGSRTAVQRARNLGTTVQVERAPRSVCDPASPFRRIYRQAMQRVGASDYCFFSTDYYENLVAGLGDDLLLVTATRHDGEPLAVALFMQAGTTMHYHLCGATAEGVYNNAIHLLIWSVMEMAADMGVQTLVLGGGERSGDGLDRFKAGFGGRKLLYSTYGLVLDHDVYDEATARHAADRGISVRELRQKPFFPAYRWAPP